MHKKAFIISFEGIEGSGKSTLASQLYSFLKKNINSLDIPYKNVFIFREPGSSPLGEVLREIILYKLDPKKNTKTLSLLFEASRSYLFEEYKDIFLEKNIIIFDRFIDSTIAYQGYGMGLDINFLEFLNLFVTENIKPDLTFLLDVDVNIAFQRIQKKKKDNIEKLSKKFFEKVRQGFLEISQRDKNRFVVLNSSKNNLKDLFEKIKSITLERLKNF